MEKRRFCVTEEHLKLLKNAYVEWFNWEFGAPGIDFKKPYGNSCVLHDICEIIGLELFEDEEGEKHLSSDQSAYCKKIHRELTIVLQILVHNLAIEVGEYELAEGYGIDWKKVV